MAKIENTTVYPTVTPTAEDLLIGTDVSNENNTVTFKISSLTTSSTLQGLQSVLDTGNSATQTMQLTGSISLLGGVNTGFIDLCQIKLGGSYGAAGQVLTSQGSGSCATWTTITSSTQGWEDTLIVDPQSNVAATMTGALFTVESAGGGISLTTGSTLTTDSSVVSTFEGDVSVFGTTLNFGTNTTLNDSTGSTGTAGAVLTVGAGGYPVWGTLPVPSTPNLQQVLTAGNTATSLGIQLTATSPLSLDSTSNIVSAGTNTFSGNNTFSANGTTLSTAGISLTGTLYAGASVGTSGQVLTSTGTGVQWSSSAGVTSVVASSGTSTGTPATISPTTGAVDIQFNTYAGGANVGYVPAGGTAGTFLQGNGSWGTVSLQDLSSVLTQGNTAANSITLTGASNSITAYTGVFTAIQDSTGSTGAASNVIVADGAGGWAWGSPASGAVSSVSTAASGTSSGNPLTITPTTGAVTVASNAYAGTTNVGHVPAGGSATTFLRGDGNWVTPTASTTTDSLVITQKFVGQGVYATGAPYTFMGIDQVAFQAGEVWINNALPNNPGAGAFTAADHMAGFFFVNPAAGSCGTAVDDLTICSIDVNFLTTILGSYEVSIYSGNPCAQEDPFTLIGSCTFEIEAEERINCCNMSLRDTALAAGLGLFLVVIPPNTELTNAFTGRVSIKFTSN
ncbi:MAG: hypothetical protein GOVbin1629_49 [Prokaryotic dsDNA virus sp.]|nr:MAG: hypothetical protein GOVbin1629_49 [Prokaryotic dsDNA virus sp.]|tara:strand:+ start:7478 stop:9511 length:2034 start_codon:yes stop_codon:yes gene_type:complete